MIASSVLDGLPPAVLPLVVVAVLAVESGTTVGLVVPGTTVALAAGAATSSLPAVAVAAALGTVLGGQIGYRTAGRATDRAAERRYPSSRPIGWLTGAFRRRPALGLLAGPWLSCGRVIVPRLAGGSGYRWIRFTVLHGPSAATWAASTTVAGHLLGVVGREHVAAGFSVAGLVVVAAGVVTWGVAWIVRRRTAPPRSEHHGDRPCATHGYIFRLRTS